MALARNVRRRGCHGVLTAHAPTRQGRLSTIVVEVSPRVEIAQSADLGTVMTYLGERALDEVRGRARGTRRADNAQAATWRLRSIRVRSGRDRAGDRRHRGLERGGQHPAIHGGAGGAHLPAAQAAAVLTDFN